MEAKAAPSFKKSGQARFLKKNKNFFDFFQKNRNKREKKTTTTVEGPLQRRKMSKFHHFVALFTLFNISDLQRKAQVIL